MFVQVERHLVLSSVVRFMAQTILLKLAAPQPSHAITDDLGALRSKADRLG